MAQGATLEERLQTTGLLVEALLVREVLPRLGLIWIEDSASVERALLAAERLLFELDRDTRVSAADASAGAPLLFLQMARGLKNLREALRAYEEADWFTRRTIPSRMDDEVQAIRFAIAQLKGAARG